MLQLPAQPWCHNTSILPVLQPGWPQDPKATVQPWNPCGRLRSPAHHGEFWHGGSKFQSCLSHARCQSWLGSPAGWAGGIHTGKSIAVCPSGQFLTGDVSLSPFGWHFSLFSQHRASTTDVAPQLEDRKVQLKHCWDTLGRNRARAMEELERAGASLQQKPVWLWWGSALLLPSKLHALSFGGAEPPRNKEIMLIFCYKPGDAALPVSQHVASTENNLVSAGPASLPGDTLTSQKLLGGTLPWLPRKALRTFPPSPAAGDRRKSAPHVNPYAHKPFP